MLATISLILFAALLGAAFCFAGYRFFLVMLPIWGFFGGFWLGAQGTSMLLGSGFLATTTGFVVGFVVGVIGAVLSYLFYLLGVGIIAGSLGGALGTGVMSALGFEPGLLMSLVTIASAVVAAVLTLSLNLQKYVIMVLMSMAGGALGVLAGRLLLGQITVDDLEARVNFARPIFEEDWYWGVLWLALVAVGVVVQIRTNKTYTFTREMYVEGWG
jgi:hypothetical protein